MKISKWWLATLAAVLSACGGGGDAVAPRSDVSVVVNGGTFSLSAGGYGKVWEAAVSCDVVAATGKCVKPITVTSLERMGTSIQWGYIEVNGEMPGYFIPSEGGWRFTTFEGEKPLVFDRPGTVTIYGRLSLDSPTGKIESVTVKVSGTGGTITVAGTPSTVKTLVGATVVSAISPSAYNLATTGTMASYKFTCPVDCYMIGLHGFIDKTAIVAGEEMKVYVNGVLLLQFDTTPTDITNGYITFTTTSLPGPFRSGRIQAGVATEVRFEGKGVGNLVTYGLWFTGIDDAEINTKSEVHGNCALGDGKSFIDTDCQKG